MLLAVHFELYLRFSSALLLRLGMVRFQIEPFESVPNSDFNSNRIVCQEIKSLKFRIDSISFDLKSIETDKRVHTKTLKCIKRCIVNIYVYMHVLYAACAGDIKNFFFAKIIELYRSFSKLLEFCKSDEN
jgi:hypothetical protein